MAESRCRNCEHAIVDSGVKCAQCQEFNLCLQASDLRRVLHFYFYERLQAARSSSRRNLKPKRAENLRLRFASSAHLLQQTEQKAKIMAERWRHWVNICNEKVVLSEYKNVINMIKTSNVKVIRVCFAGCY